MKLRLTDDSVRLRLASAEVNDFAVLGRLEDKVTFGAGDEASISYALEAADVEQVSASLAGGRLTIVLPRPVANRWTSSDDVGIRADQSAEGRNLQILVEKDLGRRFPRHLDEAAP